MFLQTLSDQSRSALADYAQRLARVSSGRVLELRLFGSTARGEARPDSDLDVLVLVDSLDFALKDIITALAWDITCERGLTGPLSPLVMTQEHFRELLARERRLALDIEAEGVPL